MPSEAWAMLGIREQMHKTQEMRLVGICEIKSYSYVDYFDRSDRSNLGV
jgi:hypothetical protein